MMICYYARSQTLYKTSIPCIPITIRGGLSASCTSSAWKCASSISFTRLCIISKSQSAPSYILLKKLIYCQHSCREGLSGFEEIDVNRLSKKERFIALIERLVYTSTDVEARMDSCTIQEILSAVALCLQANETELTTLRADLADHLVVAGLSGI